MSTEKFIFLVIFTLAISQGCTSRTPRKDFDASGGTAYTESGAAQSTTTTEIINLNSIPTPKLYDQSAPLAPELIEYEKFSKWAVTDPIGYLQANPRLRDAVALQQEAEAVFNIQNPQVAKSRADLAKTAEQLQREKLSLYYLITPGAYDQALNNSMTESQREAAAAIIDQIINPKILTSTVPTQ